MAYVHHPRIASTCVELEPSPDGTLSYVLVVDTDLALSETEEGFDGSAVLDLIKAVQGYMRDVGGFHRARIRRNGQGG